MAIASSRWVAEFGHYRGLADSDKPSTLQISGHRGDSRAGLLARPGREWTRSGHYTDMQKPRVIEFAEMVGEPAKA
jgi:hypothetical protein